MSDNCPCGNLKPYSECCQLFIDGKMKAETAEQLMRSRYTAHTKGKIDYILKTHEAGSRPSKGRNKMLKWMNAVEWMGLVILKTENGEKDDSLGKVEFRALYKENDAMQVIHEKSIFAKHKGNWFYLSGEQF